MELNVQIGSISSGPVELLQASMGNESKDTGAVREDSWQRNVCLFSSATFYLFIYFNAVLLMWKLSFCQARSCVSFVSLFINASVIVLWASFKRSNQHNVFEKKTTTKKTQKKQNVINELGGDTALR